MTGEYTHHYESVAALVGAADGAQAAGKVYGFWRHGAKFVGRPLADWAQAKAAAGAVWPEGVETIRRLADEAAAEVATQPRSRKRRAAWSEDGGDELDLDRLRGGQPAWLDCRRQDVRAPQTVTLVVNVAAPWYVASEKLFWRGAAAMVVADLLEAAGFNVEIYAGFRGRQTHRTGKGTRMTFRLKRADQPLDAATFASALSGWFFRTVILQALYVEKAKPTKHHGIPLPLRAEHMADALGCAADPVVIDGVWDRDAAVALVRQVIEQFTGEPAAA